MTDTLDMPVNSMADNASEAAALLKALAHEGRLMILCYLAGEKELSVGALEELLDKRQAAVSQLLSRLREDRLVVARRAKQDCLLFAGRRPGDQNPREPSRHLLPLRSSSRQPNPRLSLRSIVGAQLLPLTTKPLNFQLHHIAIP